MSEEMNVSTQAAAGGAKKKTPLIIAAAVVVVLAVVIGVVLYNNSTGAKVSKQLKLAQKYLAEMNYEQATAALLAAYDLDPANADVLAAIDSYLTTCTEATDKMELAAQYSDELEVALDMRQIQADYIPAIFAQANANKGLGNVDEAKDLYQEVLQKEPDNKPAQDALVDLIFPGCDITPVDAMNYSDALLKILELAGNDDADAIAAFMDSADYAELKAFLAAGNTVTLSKDGVIITLGQTGDGLYTFYGDANGYGKNVALSDTSVSVYAGSWNGGVPNGDGVLYIADKGNSITSGTVISGNLVNGVFDGTVTIDGADGSVTLQVSNGLVQVVDVDANGNLWLSDVDDRGCALVAKYATASGGYIDGLVLGVTGFGGSQINLVFEYLDVTPPELVCKLATNWDYEVYGYSSIFGMGISAYDANDGDLTDQVTCDASSMHDPYGWGELMVGDLIYTVSDAAGNTSSIALSVEYGDMCGAYFYIESIRTIE